MLGGQRSRAFGRLFVFDGSFARGHRKTVRKLLDVASIEAVFRIVCVLDHARFPVHVLRHLKNIVVVRIGTGVSHKGAVVCVIS